MKLGLLYGSKSVEHEISVLTALQVHKELKKEFDVELIYIDKDLNFYTGKKLEDLKTYESFDKVKKKLKRVEILKDGYIGKDKIDYFIPLVHGTFGEDGNIYGYLNMLNCKHIGAAIQNMSSAHDKLIMKAILNEYEIKNLEYIRVDIEDYFQNEDEIFTEAKEYGFPLIAKGTQLGSSIGVKKLTEENFHNEVKEIFKYADTIIIEKFIESFTEVNQSAYYDGEMHLSRIEEVKNSDEIYSYLEKYENLGKQKDRYRLSISEKIEDEINELTCTIYKAFNLRGIIRVDYMVIDNEVYVNELNIVPGSLSKHLYEDNVASIIRRIILTKEKAHIYDFDKKINLLNINTGKIVK